MKPPPKSIARRPSPRGKRDRALPSTPREAALQAILPHLDRFPDLLPGECRCDRLDERDAALARALYDATVRRWRTLTFLLNTRLNRPMHTLEPGLEAALLVGAAQLLLMDRIPDHAAINEAVEWVKRHHRPGAAKMANAVLRALVRIRAAREPDLPGLDAMQRRDAIALSAGGAIIFTEALLPEDPVQRASVGVGLPPWLVARWHEALGADQAAYQCLHTLRLAPVILNVTHATSDLGDIAAWDDHDEPGFKIVPPGTALGPLLKARQDIWVQDPSSAAAIASLPDTSPSVIIDVCAGQGTKTRQLLYRFPDATVIASDTDTRRLQTLRDLASTHPRLQICAAPDLASRHAGAADLVVLDVPCTNTGVLARRLEARHRCSQRQLDRLVETQRQIIADSIRLMSPNASMLYATCSLEPEECDQQADWTAHWHTRARIDAGVRWPAGLPGEQPHAYNDGARWVLLG